MWDRGWQRQVGEDLGDNRDPLLVRPFVLPDGDRQEPPLSASIWPAEQTAGELPTQLLPAVPATEADRSEQDGPGGRRRRSLFLLVGAGVTSAAIIAGYAMLRPADQPGIWISMPGHSLPVAVGPTTSASAAASELPPGVAATDNADDTGRTTTVTPSRKTSSPSAGASNPVSSSAGPAGPAGAASSSPTVVPPVPPINLAPDPITTGSGLLATGNGLCLDLRGGGAEEGREVHIDDCNGTSPQRWQLNPDRTLEVLDMCANLLGDGTVALTSCDGRATAQWQLFDDGTLINAANAQCLTDPDSGARPGRPVIVATCDGANNQRWTFR